MSKAETTKKTNKLAAVIIALMAAVFLFAATAYADDDASTAGSSNNGAAIPGTPSLTTAVPQAQTGDFVVTGDEGNYRYENGVLYVSGDVTIANAEQLQHPSSSEATATTDRIVIMGDAPITVTLNGVSIEPTASASAIKVVAGTTATIVLGEGTVNTVTGRTGHAGIEVGYDYDKDSKATILATLTITGTGTLEATGGSKSAGIGGSYANKHLVENANGGFAESYGIASYSGNIIIEGGNITATGNDGGAGIGHANNNGTNSDGTGQSASFKMQYDQIGGITINGGTIVAVGVSGAGIGGGNHTDSGVITISGGTITTSSNDGAGIGSGRGSSNYGGPANKGHGYYYADVTINGGTIRADGGWLSAGIGGGYECDAIVTINGGTIERAVGGNGNIDKNGVCSYYQGAPGIGGGYQGNVIFTMTDGTVVLAQGGWSAPGIGYGACIQEYGDKRTTDGETVSAEKSIINISGGTIKLAQGGLYAAGIGGGNGAGKVNIVISGGDIVAKGYASSEDEKWGGAGIGSGVGTGCDLKYKRETTENISITGGNVVAIGGWGASGIGSGALNETADSITLDAEKASIQAYADGTKLAIDVNANEDGTFDATSGRTVTGYILQGTFVRAYTDDQGNFQGTEGLSRIMLEYETTGETVCLELMPAGYRSYASDVANPGIYTVYTDSDKIGATNPDNAEKANGAHFSVFPQDEWKNYIEGGKSVEYGVAAGQISNYLYQFPVKTIIVDTEILAEGISEEDESGFLASISGTFYYKIRPIDENGNKGEWLTGADNKVILQPIDVVNGTAQGSAYFANMDDGDFEIWEVDANGNSLRAPITLESATITSITTATSTGTNNNVQLAPGTWADSIVIYNTYTPVRVDLTGTKTWDDGNDADGIRPESVTVHLLANGNEVASATVGAQDNWTWEFKDMMKYSYSAEGAVAIKYTIVEDAVEGYEASYDGLNVTNTHTPEKPVTPVVPTDPTDPTNPADPTNPVTPTNPTNPTNPVTPTNPATPTPTTAGTAPTALATTDAPATTAIADDATPLASVPAPTVIDDEGTPLAGGHEHGIWCWVHWWIILGMILTALYSIAVLVRRNKNSRHMNNIDKDIMGNDERRAPAPAPRPTFVPKPQPAMSARA